MKLHIPLADIYVKPTRQRQLFDDASILELANSIADKGLLHAPVVRRPQPGEVFTVDEIPTEPPGFDFVLVAGERRLKAIKLLHDSQRLFSYSGEVVKPDYTPITIVTDLSEIQVEEAELEENLLRVDLTWQERTEAYARLHKMRLEQNPDQTYEATATEVLARTGKDDATKRPNRVAAEISRATVIAEHLDKPQVAAARSAKEAYNILSREMSQDFRTELARRSKSQLRHTCIEADFTTIDWATLGKFDVICCDPPYGIDAEEFGDAALLRHGYKDDMAHALDISQRTIDLACSVLKRNGIAYIFCDIDLFVQIRDYAESKDLNPLRTPLIWDKGGGMGHIIGEGFGIRRSYEFILMIFEGKKATIETCRDILAHAPIRDKVHAAQKPVELYTRLLTLASIPGSRVIDPCCGSGTIFGAAAAAHMYATGIENDAEIFKLAQDAALRAEGDTL